MEEFLTSSTKKTMSNDANKLRQRQEIRKYLVFAGMFLLFVGCMWLIFAPSKEERQREERNAGFNSELPDPRGAGIEADKIAAYEQADMKRRQEEKMRTLEDFPRLPMKTGRMKQAVLSWKYRRSGNPKVHHPIVAVETAGMGPYLRPHPPITILTPRSAVSMRHREKTPKRRH